MYNDRLLSFFAVLAVFALMLLVPGLAGLVGSLLTGIPGFYSALTVVISGIAFCARWVYLRRKNLA